MDGCRRATRRTTSRASWCGVPIDARKFNGTVIVEWLNVSAGLDAAPDWTFTHPMLKREGFAWVGVSAQLAGVSGTGGPIGLDLSLKSVNPVRYAPLVHPGDSFSYDMFSQVAQAIRHPVGLAPLGNLKPRRVIAIGESQSAFRLVTYVDAIHPLAQVYDGFLIHSRGDDAAPLSEDPQPAIDPPTPVFIRTDVDVPVLIFETETDLTALGYFNARQPDTDRIRLWEVAGTAHDDAYGLGVGPGDAGNGAIDTTYIPPQTSVFGVITCAEPINAGPQHYVENAALVRLNRWVRTGRAHGASAPRMQVVARAADHHRARRVRQRPGRHPDAAGGRAGRDPVGARTDRRRVLLALRDDDRRSTRAPWPRSTRATRATSRRCWRRRAVACVTAIC